MKTFDIYENVESETEYINTLIHLYRQNMHNNIQPVSPGVSRASTLALVSTLQVPPMVPL